MMVPSTSGCATWRVTGKSSTHAADPTSKHIETLSGYFDLYISDKIPAKSPYVSDYWITIDINNIIHEIYGHKEYPNLTKCQAVLASLLSTLEKKYEIDFNYWEPSYPTFKIYSHNHYTSSGNYFALQCREYFEDSPFALQMFLKTKIIGEAIEDFYDSGLSTQKNILEELYIGNTKEKYTIPGIRE